jgi:hypothetical protein
MALVKIIKSRSRERKSILPTTCCLIAVGTSRVAYKAESKPAPPGEVSLQLVGMSGTDAEFVLGNGTSKAIGLLDARSLVPGFDFSTTGGVNAPPCYHGNQCA